MGILDNRFHHYNGDLKESKTKILKSILDNVKYSFLENKTGLIIKKGGRKFSEEFVRDYFEGKGYIVLRGRSLKSTSVKHRILMELLFCFFAFDEKKLDEFLYNLKRPGKPDFLVYTDHSFFFVEVKGENGGLQKNQIQFLEYLNDLKIPNFVFLVHKQESLKNEQESE